MAVCISSDDYNDDAHYGYGVVNGSHISYSGDFLESEGNPQSPSAMGSNQATWPGSQQLDLSSLGAFWQQAPTCPPCEQQDFGNAGGSLEFEGQQNWVNGGMWGQTPDCPSGGDGDWRGGQSGRGSLVDRANRAKRRFCTSYPEVMLCRRGAACAFAHSREEINAPLLEVSEEQQDPAALTDEFFMYKYKTRWCPIGVQHEWHTCVYAHNYQDARRPVDIGYGARLCPYWSKKDTGAEYSQRCPLGLRCPYSHGAKEQLYHPHYFKTVVCRDLKGKACPRQLLCAFFHNRAERRLSPPDDVDYSQPLLNESLPADWVSDFLTPPFMPDSSKIGGGGACNEDAMQPMGSQKVFDGGVGQPAGESNAVVPFNQQQMSSTGGNPQGQFPQMQGAAHGPVPGPCIMLLPCNGMMPMSPGGVGGQNGMSADMQQPMQPQQAGGMPGMPPQWVFVPMDGNGQPTY